MALLIGVGANDYSPIPLPHPTLPLMVSLSNHAAP